MKKNAIWVIIGMMSAALIGIAWMQVDLIRSAVKVKEEKFRQNVFESLNAVSERLEQHEKLEAMRYLNVNGYTINYYAEQMAPNNNGALRLSAEMSLGHLTSKELHSSLMGAFETDCPRCRAEKYDYTSRLINSMRYRYYERASKVPLVERINLEQLDAFIGQELADRGIDTEYQYGVYSNPKRSFVIADGHYMIEDPRPKEFLPGYENLYTSDFRVNLFSGDDSTPGLLMIHFPEATSFVWSSLWMNLLGSILFTGIILFCFAYTINVIFRQKKLSEMKTDFINNMTHEFKTPIATISLAADSISSPIIAGKADKVQRFANIIKQENRRMNSQVEKVLQMALLDKEDHKMKFTDVNLHEVIQQAVENINLQVEKKDGTVQSHLNARKPIVEADLTHISNVINNLLDNANKYSPEKPEILVHTRNVANGVEVIIEDHGIGMSKEARKHIFDKFYRVHTGDLHDVKGFGLGLSYVKAMMTAHKGTIDVKSELGKGSSFILFFPFHVEN